MLLNNFCHSLDVILGFFIVQNFLFTRAHLTSSRLYVVFDNKLALLRTQLCAAHYKFRQKKI